MAYRTSSAWKLQASEEALAPALKAIDEIQEDPMDSEEFQQGYAEYSASSEIAFLVDAKLKDLNASLDRQQRTALRGEIDEWLRNGIQQLAEIGLARQARKKWIGQYENQ
jgi:hypothetical protein